MPYMIKGSDVYHKKQGVWKIKQRCSSHANAVKAVRLMQMVEHGGKPKGK